MEKVLHNGQRKIQDLKLGWARIQFFSFIYSSYSGWRSKIGLLREFRDVIYVVS
jgi:hypothetical protein